MEGSRPVTYLFRWNGTYWGFLQDAQLYDRHGHHAGWVESRPGAAPDVFGLSGAFMGELVDGHHVLRSILRPAPVHRAARAAVPVRTPPVPPVDRQPAIPRDGWTDALPWPLRSPDPPEL